jgi:hypothetical protein
MELPYWGDQGTFLTEVYAMDISESDATKLLIDFFDAMYTWEKEAYQALNPSDPSSLAGASEALSAIYSTYLTKKDRKTGEQAGPSVGATPRYNKELEKIVSVETDVAKGKVLITTEKVFENTPDFKETSKYTLVSKKNGLLIDKKEIFSAYRQKWVNIVF